ncbi:hypothetical protein HOY82DRAFT_172194 [Tuber indicum]|nr:hypothetical protein HOY82DRAFT_172194 [Tuber indicum]
MAGCVLQFFYFLSFVLFLIGHSRFLRVFSSSPGCRRVARTVKVLLLFFLAFFSFPLYYHHCAISLISFLRPSLYYWCCELVSFYHFSSH